MEDKFKKTEKLKTYIQITRITILICWISLFAFWAVKLFGGNFFEIVVNNENFVAFSNKVETTWLKYLVSFFTIAIAKYLTFGAICQKFVFKGKQFIVICLSIVSIWFGVNFLNSDFVKMWYAYILYVVIGLLYQEKWKKGFGILAILLELLFAVVSIITRNLPIEIMSNYLIAIIFSVDLYLMATLYFLYSNLIKMKKEK